MAKIHPYHTNSPEHRREVYHDQDDCPDGKRIEHKHRVEGTDNRKHCLECEKIEHHHHHHHHPEHPPKPPERPPGPPQPPKPPKPREVGKC